MHTDRWNMKIGFDITSNLIKLRRLKVDDYLRYYVSDYLNWCVELLTNDEFTVLCSQCIREKSGAKRKKGFIPSQNTKLTCDHKDCKIVATLEHGNETDSYRIGFVYFYAMQFLWFYATIFTALTHASFPNKSSWCSKNITSSSLYAKFSFWKHHHQKFL